MKVKGIPWEQIRAELLNDPEVAAAYEEEKRNYELQETLTRYAQACNAQLVIRAEPVSA